MRPMTAFFLLALIAIAVTVCAATELPAWEFNTAGDLEGWSANDQVRNLRIAHGALCAETRDQDPIMLGPMRPFATSIAQRVEVRMSSDRGGAAEIFWAPTTEEPYDGFRPGREAGFEVSGDGKFHTYVIYPFWQGEPQIVRLRLDPPDNAKIAIDYVRVVQTELAATDQTSWDFASGLAGLAGWQALRDVKVERAAGKLLGRVTGPAPLLISPRITADTSGLAWLVLRMCVDAGRIGEAQVMSQGVPGAGRKAFPLVTDKRFHTYNVLIAGAAPGQRRAIALGVAPSLEANARFEIASVALRAVPAGAPDLELLDFGAERAVARVGRESRIIGVVRNRGGEPITGLRATLSVPGGVLIAGSQTVAAEAAGPVGFGDRAEFRWPVLSTQPGVAEMTVTIAGDNLEAQTYDTKVDYTTPPSAQPAMIDGKPYVPEPRPARGEWQVGVYYFPGWKSAGSWDPIDRARFPIPYLGFYREGDPEVADWHIKWAVEHGINFFVYDWYWCQGGTSLMHALHDGYMHARYRNYLKFCLLWANHNPPKTSSEQDLLAVTRFWLDNYFKLPEYQTVDGKPMVVIFTPDRLREDMGSQAVRAAFEKMRALCRAEGLPGLYLVGCAVPGQAPQLAREGYDAATAYNYPSAGAEGKRWAPYDTMVSGFEKIWREFFDRGEIRYILPLSPGWDNRPWAGDDALVRYGNTPDRFEDMCRRAKTLLETRGKSPESRMVIIEAWNEFGEGSHIEPTKPYGFGYLDAVRRVFTNAPAAHHDIVPEDVGLGPYDVAMGRYKLAWEFNTPGDDEGWGSVMGMTEVRAEGGSLKATTTSDDPAFFGPPVEIDAARYRRVLVRMRVDMPGQGQLFWRTTLAQESEATSYSFPLAADGEFHEYALPVGEVATWSGRVLRLRLDPCFTRSAHVEIDYIRVVE